MTSGCLYFGLVFIKGFQFMLRVGFRLSALIAMVLAVLGLAALLRATARLP